VPLPAKPLHLSNQQKSRFSALIAAAKKTKNGCSIWQGRLDGHGRARFGHEGFVAARVVWWLANGDIPEGQCVCHSCDNPACVNLEHLWLGDHVKNMKDRDAKGRNVNCGRVSIGGLYQESLNHEPEILRLRKKGVLAKEISNRVGLAYATVVKILDKYPATCPICERVFHRQKALGMHLRRAHMK